MNKKTVAILFFTALVIIIGLAAWLMFENKEGWGWLIFMAFVLCSTSFSELTNKDK